MSDFIPKAGSSKTAGLGPKAQKLAAMREKAAAQASTEGKHTSATGTAKVKTLAGNKKTSFQRKAV